MIKYCLRLFLLSILLPITKTKSQVFHPTPNHISATVPQFVCSFDNFSLLESVDSSDYEPSGPVSSVSGYAPSAIDICGKIAVYYDDQNLSTKMGFDDTTHEGGLTLGQIRRQTFHNVLAYIQSVFDFSLISSSDLLKIHVKQSYAHIPGYYAPPGAVFLAKAQPVYGLPPNRYIGGYFNDYVLSGVDTAYSFHAEVTVNFDSTMLGLINYQNSDTSAFEGCRTDLFSTLLHEMSHAMGWLSFVAFLPPPIDSIYTLGGDAMNNIHPYAVTSTNTFTKIDSAIQVGIVFPDTVLHKMILGSPGASLYINPSPLINCNNNYWINNLPAPNNYPVFSGVGKHDGNPGVMASFVSHLDDQQESYLRREHISPGNRDEYVIGPYGIHGVRRREFSKGEIQTFCSILGYKYIGADSAVKLGNHRPFSKKMARLSLDDGGLCADTVTADYVFVNNGGTLTIDLASFEASGELVDGDGDSIRIDTNTLSNMRGCGDGNNHDRLAVSSGNRIISYTPRHDFYGRAQMGFDLSDGKESGSYFVITVDVLQGLYPPHVPGGNMILNPGFENGTEMKVVGMENIPYTVADEDGMHEGKWQGLSLSDGHPFSQFTNLWSPYGSGIAVSSSLLYCGSNLAGYSQGSPSITIPSFSNTLLCVDTGVRYQSFYGSDALSYYYLSDTLQACQRYALAFDAYTTHATATDIPVVVGFKDDTSSFLSPTFTQLFIDTLHAVSPTTWNRFNISFWYCGSHTSHILTLADLGAYFEAGIAIDNLSLTTDTSAPPPLIVSITDTGTSGCRDELTVHVAHPACSVSYLWDATDASSRVSAKDTVASDVPHTYTVNVHDGCRDSAMTFSISLTPPGPISGPSNLCTGGTITLADTVSGGVWSSSNTGVATVNISTGVVTGVSAGTAIITYTSYCSSYVTYAITVNAPPTAISGPGSLCVGSTMTLTDTTMGGIWSSASPSIADIGLGSGIVTGLSGGVVVITYSTGIGCFATAIVSVNTTPNVGYISLLGSTHGCVGMDINVFYPYGLFAEDTSISAHGNWTVNDTSIAQIVSLSTGTYHMVLHGVSAGTAIVTYSLTNSCGTSITTVSVNIYTSPAAITGLSSLCEGTSTAFIDTTGGGTWSSSNPTVATAGITSGIVTGIAAGTAIISYALTYTGCASTKTITVNTAPATIGGLSAVCTGSSITLTDIVVGGTWSSSNTARATVGAGSGIVTGVGGGSVTITYSIGSCMVTKALTVNVSPFSISGPSSVCAGSTITLTDGTMGGTWTSSNTSIATVAALSGVVTGVSSGIVTITYSTIAGCIATKSMSVAPTPAAISGAAGVCAGLTTTLTDATSGGIWSSGTTAIATIGSSTGIVTGVMLGSTTISYSLGTCRATISFHVYIQPPPLAGIFSFCSGTTTTLSDSVTGGTFTSSNTAVVTIGTTIGTMTGVSAGTATITYVLPDGCFTTHPVTVNQSPGPITGLSHICQGTAATLVDTTSGGSWSSGAPGIALIGTGTGIVTGVLHGTAVISYTMPSGCFDTATLVVDPIPSSLYGPSQICEGSTMSLTDSVVGGGWSSSSTSVATVSAGVVTGVSAGVATISYTLSAGCYVTKSVTINPLPDTIVGNRKVCLAGHDTLFDATTGGKWFSSPTTTATVDSLTGIVSGLLAGIDTIIYKLSTGCLSSVVLKVYDTSCSPCNAFGNDFTPLGLSGSFSGNLTHGNYYIANNLTIYGADTFTNAIIMIAPGDTLFVDSSASLTLDSCHIFSACDLWRGIVLRPGVTHSARLALRKQTMIEDAFTGVFIDRPVTPSDSGYTLYSDGAIFNLNRIGVDIEHYNSLDRSYPFLVRNTVFTSRHLSNVIFGTPYFRPNTMGPHGLKTSCYIAGYPFTPQFNIDSSNGSGWGAYGSSTLKNGGTAYIGIKIDSVGADTLQAHGEDLPIGIPNYYADIVIGDASGSADNMHMNMFDNLVYGIYATNSNLSCENNLFMHMNQNITTATTGTTGSTGGTGIYAHTTNDITNQNRLRVYVPEGDSTIYNNRFYNCLNGVECYNYFRFIGQHTFMTSTQPAGALAPPTGKFGYVVKSSKYDSVEIRYDTINNVRNGIAFWATTDWAGLYPSISQYTGRLMIDSNLIQANPVGYYSGMSQSVDLAIAVQNIVSSYRFYLGRTKDSVYVNNNIINDAYNGIYINNFQRQMAMSNSNSIYVRPWNAKSLQYGINHTSSFKTLIYNNYIASSLGASAAGDSMRAYYAASNTGINIGCNVEENTGRGYEFFLNNYAAAWHDNYLTNNIKGLTLNGGVIGTQKFGGNPSNNIWTTSSWDTLHPQTYVYHGANSINDTLYVTSSATTNPVFNDGIPTLFRYSTGLGSIHLMSGLIHESPCPGGPVVWYGAGSAQLYELIAREHIDYPYAWISRNWIGQYELWKSVLADSTMIDSSVTIAVFDSLSRNSRYKYVTDMEGLLAEGNYDSVTVMLGWDIDSMANASWDTVTQVQMADNTSTDFIVENYQAFFSLYIKYMRGMLNGSDSLAILALGQLCPEINGTVVYQARAMYSEIYRDLSVFNDDSCLDVDTSYIAEKYSHGPIVSHDNKKTGQFYSLYPNPNAGTFTLQQNIADDKPVQITIWDALGRKIHSENTIFDQKKWQIKLQIPPSLYFLSLQDSQHNVFTFKFVAK